ncbi:MAG: UDP-N-acetylglucosamine 1-carboxyvinyltransferase [Candidatus Paceibacterota bacterium]|jgi:UDP-N-acetylglucosamine 1-carboxyvinyltransferase
MIGTNDKFVITGLAGRKTLSGRIGVGGAKNAILKVLAASILFRDGFSASNVPMIEDVAQMLNLLKELGGQVKALGPHLYELKADSFNNFTLASDLSKKLRASIVLTGPLLARFGEVHFPFPGGCIIGKRPIDLFLDGFKKMGAQITETDGLFIVKAPNAKLKGAEIFFKKQSVTVTETFLMAAVLATGKTILKNCAFEPEIESLGEFLIKCGAKIKGLGTSTLEIEGGELLSGSGQEYVTVPDRIEAGSFIILGALAATDLTVENCRPDHLDSLINLLRETGVELEVGDSWVRVKNLQPEKQFTAVDIKTHEYPGFPTDLQAPLSIFLTQAVGQSFIFETIFEGRLNYLEALNRLGAKTKILDAHRAIVDGPTPLSGHEIESPDLRAGLAYVLAAVIAYGQSVVHNVKYIDRGYEQIEKRLRAIGVKIERIVGNKDDLCLS